MTTRGGAVIARSPTARWRRTSRRIVIAPSLTSESDELVELEGVAAIMWRSLGAPVTIDELSRDLAEAFSAPVPDVEAAVADLVAELAERGVLEVREP